MRLSFFHPQLGQTGELGNGVEYWRGYYQFLRTTQMGLSLTVVLLPSSPLEIHVEQIVSIRIALTLPCF
jgi:hypothetical protein